jgi:YVTN family beta-propeller protein
MRRRLIAVVVCATVLCSAALWRPGLVRVAAQSTTTPEERYASPLELLLSPDGTRLYVLCQGADEVRVLNAASGRVLRTMAVGHIPRGFSLSGDGRRLFVANSWDDTVTVIDTDTGEVKATWAAGFEPSSVVEDKAGKLLYVADRIGNNVSVLDATTGEEKATLAAGRGASYLAMSADGRRLYATHVYPAATAQRTPPRSEITVIDPARARVVDRMMLPDIAGVFHVALSRDGRLGVVGELHPKNLVPLAHVEHGWAFVDTLTVFGADVGRSVEVPLDEVDRYYAMPFGLAIAPDKSRIYVTQGGSGCLTVIDTKKLLAYIHAHPEPFAEDLSASGHYVVARVVVGKNPRGLVLSRDGSRLFVANRLDDSISVVSTRENRVGGAEDGVGIAAWGTDFLHGEVCVSGAVWMLELPYRFDVRWVAVGSGAGWFWQGHCRQSAHRRSARDGAFQVEWRQSDAGQRVRASDGDVFFSFAEFRRSHPHGFGALHPQFAFAAESISCSEWRVDAGAGAGSSDLLPQSGQVGAGDRREQPVCVLSQRAEGDKSKIV